MDEVLQRILLLIPKDQSGKYVRGSKKELADFLGLPHNIVAEWISGRNKSYLKYLYQIAAKYDVSVEWLRGKTDEKKPTAVSGELDDATKELQDIWGGADQATREAILAAARMFKSRGG